MPKRDHRDQRVSMEHQDSQAELARKDQGADPDPQDLKDPVETQEPQDQWDQLLPVVARKDQIQKQPE